LKELYFVRHGLSELNVAGKYAGTLDTPLVKAGQDQARLAGQQAKKLNIDYIISSPLSRALDSAKIIAEVIHLPTLSIEVNSLLVERHYGVMEGQPWNPDLDVDGVADVETIDNLLKRAQLALQHIESMAATNVLVVSHGGFGRALRLVINPAIPFNDPNSPFKNAEIVRLI
jgi:uncharacterized phosphatase